MLNLWTLVHSGLVAVIIISCNKQDTVTNPGSNDGTTLDNPKGGHIMATPKITSISPASAKIGTVITITGANLNYGKGQSYFVTFNGKKATVYQSWSQTQIKVLVPSGSSSITGKVTVTVGNQTSNGVNFIIMESSPVLIGNQTWMGHNLDVTTYRNGDLIREVTDQTEWENLTTGAWCYYNNDPANGPIYGKLYNWYAVNDPRGLAPVGWHTPTDAEFKTLSMFLGMSQEVADQYGYSYFGTDEGGKIKEQGTSLWLSPNYGASNSSGFTAVPNGMRGSLQEYGWGFWYGNTFGAWWSSSECTVYNDIPRAWMRGVSQSASTIYNNGLNQKYGFAVRCIRD